MKPNDLLRFYFLARIIDWRHNLEALDGIAVANLMKVLKAANNQLRSRLESELPQAWASYTSDKGGAAVKIWLQEILTEPAIQVENTISEAWAISGQTSLAVYNDILSIGGMAKNIATVPITLDSVMGLASKKLFSGYTMKQLVAKSFTEGQIANVMEALDTGIANGWGYPKVIKHLQSVALDKGLEISKRENITLARSYIQQASVNAQRAVYEANKDVVHGVEWCAILDNKICRLCAATDGNHYTFSEETPPMPRHPRCRCLWLPWVKSWREMGIDADDLERAARPWLIREEGNIDEGGKRKIENFGTTKDDYAGWWKTLPYKQQIKSIGPVRTRLINEGKLSWKDLQDKNTGHFYTLEELGFTESGKPLQKN